jgi:hypothetical protein
MPCVPKTGNATHDTNCLQAEVTRQASVAGNPTQAQVKAADIQFYKTCRDSAFNAGLPHAWAVEALGQLGVAPRNPLAP